VPGRYLLQLFLPFCIKDEAESVKFSSKREPPTLTVTLAVDSSIAPPAAAPSAPPQSTAAADSLSSNGVRRRLRPQRRQQQQQQPSTQHSSSSIWSSLFALTPENYPAARNLFGFNGFNDQMHANRKFPSPFSGACDWLDATWGHEVNSIT
jgi:hypothetical protein